MTRRTLLRLLECDEFNVPVSESSRKRRLSYMQEVSRKQFAENFSDDYDAYLRNLGMTLEVFAVGPQNQQRCFELVSRSNQLNLTTNRYTEEEFQQLLKRDDVAAFAFGCKDKFGDYGIISFLSLQIDGSEGRITDFVVSCRVAKKKVENAIITSLKEPLAARGIQRLKAMLISGPRRTVRCRRCSATCCSTSSATTNGRPSTSCPTFRRLRIVVLSGLSMRKVCVPRAR